ncbi:hypothetical protein [Nitratireductor basaltis]|uniref:Uncharacterized protein n=1 Tax=Nitratireductor basaltis TaxID=472175 RepID=A0A084UCG5_9HYPH|nr:hypothetical protein [Nitratireductor basaltis]KFB10651.1 hypothetical protein EL18_01689 [Nitratireductor basaltis]
MKLAVKPRADALLRSLRRLLHSLAEEVETHRTAPEEQEPRDGKPVA